MSRLSTSAAFSFLLIIISGPVKPSRWQKWGPWSHCSTTCDKGHRVRARACSGSHGSCPGKPTKTKDCLGDKCPGCLFQICILLPHSPCLLVLIVSTCLILSVTSLCFFTCLYDHWYFTFLSNLSNTTYSLSNRSIDKKEDHAFVKNQSNLY